MSVKLELISIHIPKTGGTSFRNTLQDIYGKEAVQLCYGHKKEGSKIKINPESRVLHGHISIREYDQLVENYPTISSVPLITWVRNPIERVISNYYYYLDAVSSYLEPSKEKYPGLQKRITRSLLEFARQPVNRNVQSRHIKIEWMKSKQLRFIGIMEQYDEDLNEMKEIFGWDTPRSYKHNETKNKYEVAPDIRSKIESLNGLDLELFHLTVSLREKHGGGKF